MINIPYGRQWVDEEDVKEITEVLQSDWITQGPKISEFENAVANYCGSKYAVAFSSATAALHVAYKAIGIKKDDEVITTPLTFAATSNTICHCQGKPVFADIEDTTLNINAEKIQEKITNKTKAISAVDFAGHPCDYDKILEIAKKHNLLVVEDSAHSLGAEYKGKKIGGLADITVFSFHPVKAITTGEGGMAVTNSKELFERMMLLRSHGIVKKPEIGGWYYEIQEPGFNYRICDIQCALGLSQFRRLDQFIKRRRDIAATYNNELKDFSLIQLPVQKEYANPAWHIYPIRLKLEKLKVGRKEIFDAFKKEGIGVQVHYIPLHMHPFYQSKFNYKVGDFPSAEKYYKEAITLPLYPKMTDEQVHFVISKTKEIINSFKK